MFSLKHTMRHLLNTRNFYMQLSLLKMIVVSLPLKFLRKFGLGSLRTTSLFATAHISATLGNVTPIRLS